MGLSTWAGFKRWTSIQVREKSKRRSINRNGILNPPSSQFPNQVLPPPPKSNFPHHSVSIDIPLDTPSLTYGGNPSLALWFILLTELQPHGVLSVSVSVAFHRLSPLPRTSASTSLPLNRNMTPSGELPSHSIRVPVVHSPVTANISSPHLREHTPAPLLSCKLLARRDCVNWPHQCIQGPAQCLTPGRFSNYICSMNDCPKHPYYLLFYSTPQSNPGSHHLTTNCFPRFQAPLVPIQPSAVNCQFTFLKYHRDSPLLWLITQRVLTPHHGFQVLSLSHNTNWMQFAFPLCLWVQPAPSLSQEFQWATPTFCISKAYLSLNVKLKMYLSRRPSCFTLQYHTSSPSLDLAALIISCMFILYPLQQADQCQERGESINTYWTSLGVSYYMRYKISGCTVSTIKTYWIDWLTCS